RVRRADAPGDEKLMNLQLQVYRHSTDDAYVGGAEERRAMQLQFPDRDLSGLRADEITALRAEVLKAGKVLVDEAMRCHLDRLCGGVRRIRVREQRMSSFEAIRDRMQEEFDRIDTKVRDEFREKDPEPVQGAAPEAYSAWLARKNAKR